MSEKEFSWEGWKVREVGVPDIDTVRVWTESSEGGLGGDAGVGGGQERRRRRRNIYVGLVVVGVKDGIFLLLDVDDLEFACPLDLVLLEGCDELVTTACVWLCLVVSRWCLTFVVGVLTQTSVQAFILLPALKHDQYPLLPSAVPQLHGQVDAVGLGYVVELFAEGVVGLVGKF